MGHVPSKDFVSQPFVMDLVGRSAGQERLVGIGLTKYYFPSAEDPLFKKFCAVRGENHVRHWYDRPEEVPLDEIPPVPSDEELYHRFIDAPSALVDQGLDIPDWSPIPLMIVKMDDPNDISLPNAENCVVVGYFACIDYQMIAKKLPSLGGDDNDEEDEEPRSPTRNTVPITNIVKRLDVAAASSNNPIPQYELLFNEFNTAHIFMSNRFYNEAKSICCFRLACACYDFYSRKAHLTKKALLPAPASASVKKQRKSPNSSRGSSKSGTGSGGSSTDDLSSEDVSPKGTPLVDPLARLSSLEASKFQVPWPRGMGYETFQTNLPRLRLTQQLNAVCYSLGLDITSEALVELRPNNRVYLGLHGQLLSKGGSVISRSVDTRSMSFIQRGFSGGGAGGGKKMMGGGNNNNRMSLANILASKGVLQPLHCLEMTKSVIAAPSETGFDNGQATVKLLNDLIERARETWSEANAAVIAFQKRRKPVNISPPPQQPSGEGGSSKTSPHSNAPLSRRNSTTIKSPSPAGTPLASEFKKKEGAGCSNNKKRSSAATSPYPSSSSEDDFEPVSSASSQQVDGAVILRLLKSGPTTAAGGSGKKSAASKTTAAGAPAATAATLPSFESRATPTPPSGLTSPPELALNPHTQQQGQDSDADGEQQYPSFRSNDSFRGGSDSEGPAAAVSSSSAARHGKLRQMRPPASPNRAEQQQQPSSSSSNISASALFPKHQDPSSSAAAQALGQHSKPQQQEQQQQSSITAGASNTTSDTTNLGGATVQRQNTPYTSGPASPMVRHDSSSSMLQQQQQKQQQFAHPSYQQQPVGGGYPPHQQQQQQYLPQSNNSNNSQFNNSLPSSLNGSFNPAGQQQYPLPYQQQQQQQQQHYNDSSSYGGGSDSASNPNSSGGRNAARFDPMSLQQQYGGGGGGSGPYPGTTGPYPSFLLQHQQPYGSPLGASSSSAAPNQFQGHKIISTPPQQGSAYQQQNGAPPPVMHLKPPGSHPSSSFPGSSQQQQQQQQQNHPSFNQQSNNQSGLPNQQVQQQSRVFIGECTPVTVCNSNKEWVQKYWKNPMKALVRHPSWQPHLDQGFVCYSIDHTELELFEGKTNGGQWVPEKMQSCAPMLFLEKGETVYTINNAGDYIPGRAD